jgi:hypothetical protein
MPNIRVAGVVAALSFVLTGLVFPSPVIRTLFGAALIAMAFLFLTLRHVSGVPRDQWYVLPAALCLVLIGLSDLLPHTVFAAARVPLLLVFFALWLVAVVADRH